jgi:hypothetical protein
MEGSQNAIGDTLSKESVMILNNILNGIHNLIPHYY